MSHYNWKMRAPLLAGVAWIGLVAGAQAASFDLTTTGNAAQTLSSSANQIGTVEPGASIVTAGVGVTWDATGTAGIATLNNSGIINGTTRGIDDNSTATAAQSLTINNLTATSLITSTADALRLNKDILGGTVTVNNSGTMQSTGAQQVLDFAAITSAATIKITNNSGALMTTAGNSAIELGGAVFSILNNGTIQATGAAFRGINYKPTSLTSLASYNLVNGSATNSAALIASTDDAVRISAGEIPSTILATTNIPSMTAVYTVAIDNFGTIKTTGSGSGQAIDFADVISSKGKVTITNEATGILSAADADGVRPGTNATLTNYGKISSGFISTANGNLSGNDAVDFQSNAGGVVNNMVGGSITGAKNGVTAKYAPTITNAGTITGLDGSGINIDTSRDATPANPDITATGIVTVVNTGTIIGNAVSADGDAIDVDYLTNITNSGTIKAVGIVAPAVGSLNEALAIGGGSVINNVGGLIISDQRAITVDDSNKGNAFGAISIDNAGTITGNNGSAIAITSILSNTLTNRATGVINGSVVMGSGDDTVNLYAGSTLNGTLDGGAGTDTLNLLGPGSATFTGASNFETLNVQGGSWTLSGTQSYASAVTVSSGATLNATGTIASPSVTVASGGTLKSGGTAPGTLNITGSLSLAAGANYAVAVTPTAASLTNVSGTASINGTLTTSLSSGAYTAGQRYTVLTATGGVSGTFAALTTAAPSYLKPRVGYDANNVFLFLDQVSLAPTLFSGASANQKAVASTIDAAIAKGAVPNASFTALYGLSGPALASALDQISGQVGPNVINAVGQSFQPFLTLMTQNTGGESGSFAPGSTYGGAAAPKRAQLAPGAVRLWGAAFGGHADLSADAVSGAAGLSSSNVGFAAGVDMQIDDGLLAGASIGIGRQQFASGNGTGNSDDLMLGVTARQDVLTDGYVQTAFGYGRHQIKTLRLVTVAGTDVLIGKLNADDFGGRIEGGYRLALDEQYGLTPFAAFAGTSFETPAYAENAASGSSAFALSYAAHASTVAHTELGAHLGRRFDMDTDGMLSAELHAAWAHELDDTTLALASFQGLPGPAFQVTGVRSASDTALLGVNLQVQNPDGLSYGVRLDSQVGPGTTAIEGMGNLAWRW
jgi:uncharacterized protein with beta-barrel porin domain